MDLILKTLSSAFILTPFMIACHTGRTIEKNAYGILEAKCVVEGIKIKI
jgi:hypothetical protein